LIARGLAAGGFRETIQIFVTDIPSPVGEAITRVRLAFI
jgi:hypothetical protein